MLVKIYLHGHLRNKVKKEYIEINANTVIDVLHYLANTYKEQLKAPLDVGRWRVKIKDFETKESWYVPLFVNELHIYPVFRTAKSGLTQIAIGSLLIVGGLLLGVPTGGSSLSLTQVGGAMLFSAGVSMVANGLIGLFFPTPKLDTSAEASTNSKYLGASGNTVAAGTRIPFGYGLFKISGHYISYNVSSEVVKDMEAR